MIILFLWAYVWLVDMPPSACRAAGMFALYIIGATFQRRSHPLNILGATGIIALIADPFLINSLGFQFSYLALLGILTIGLPLYRAVNFRSKVLSYFWATVAISIGAQFFLLPVLAYYFNEVSAMSVFSSLIAIPAAYLIVFSGVLLVITTYIFPGAAELIGLLLSKFIEILTGFLELLSSHSWSTIQRLYINGPEVLLILIILLLIAMRILTGATLWLRPMIILALTFLIYHSTVYAIRSCKTIVTFYPAEGNMAFELFHSGRSFQYGLDQL